MSKPLVSVCVTTYNHERYIRACLNSVLMQTECASLEILVGDDSSNDETTKIVNEIANLNPGVIRHIRNIKNKGATKNLNYLIQEARGQYIAHLDGDDFWLPGKIAAQISFLENYTDCPAVYTNAFCINDDGSAAGLFTNYKYSRISTHELIRRGNFLNHSPLLYRGNLKKFLVHPSCNMLDYSIHINLASHGRLGFLNQPLTTYRVSSRTSIITHSGNYIRELYWATLSSVKYPYATNSEISAGMAEFLRTIFFQAILQKSLSPLSYWLPRILKNAPSGKIIILAQAISAIIRRCSTIVASRIYKKLTGNPMKILYPR
ncbi:glycosyltransferase family 2 protein [Macromonas nakdongensis]|uniref:glycosyltransferase family 2 protein n=1 Tax=Macromonas nakdongensis TaxID=1843082 RepID=UPI000C34964C|nr:glycosyltransferase [Macromonas nakdongensis]